MIFKYTISKSNGEEKTVIGATQAREVIKDLLTFHDIEILLAVKDVRKIMEEQLPAVVLVKRVADWVVNNLYKEYRFENGSIITSTSDHPQRIDFENFSIEVIVTNSISK